MNFCLLVPLRNESEKLFSDKWVSLIAVDCVIVLAVFDKGAIDVAHSSLQTMGWLV